MVVEQQLERARLELLDMGLRANPQLNYRSGGRAIDIIDEQSATIFELLVVQEQTLSFLPLPEAYQQKIADDADDGIFVQGMGCQPTPNADITVHYAARLATSKQPFDSSYARGEPGTYPLNRMILAWREGIPMMQKYHQRLLMAAKARCQ